MSIKVKAKFTGYFGSQIKNAGDVFLVEKEEQLSAIWMERLDGKKIVKKGQKVEESVESKPKAKAKAKAKPVEEEAPSIDGAI